MSGNPLLATTAETHWRFLRRVMAAVLRHAEPAPVIWKQHEEILAAISGGNAQAAIERAQRHAEGAAKRLARALSTAASHAATLP